ncbi:MAG: nucleotidyltransferase domain-containing protein [Elusimicrobia bacterium CG_4_10_14_3_um_filter_49_12_50_7]|nr:MAG: nucleotidyltransferase domain-containing protein [Elusimicrobia bacterium CG_4_8_14_3_um_filter_50_9]PIY18103.1 MAG: nucleotidyltransferase domain-containing protein [Elusimicrobia bacterium CG_4_10_14_3_um_filter_49_12_50_7]
MREEQILNDAAEILKKELNPEKIILFGSRAKGGNSKHADFDFAVDVKSPDITKKRKLEEKLDEIAGLYKIDVVYLKSVEDDFRDIVLKTGKIVYERGN